MPGRPSHDFEPGLVSYDISSPQGVNQWLKMDIDGK
jgi:hypothetical protein